MFGLRNRQIVIIVMELAIKDFFITNSSSFKMIDVWNLV